MNNKSKTIFANQTNNKCCTKEVYIALVGSLGVGKSALMVKYITKRFIGEYSSEYEGIWHKTELVDGKELIVHIYDTYDKDRKNLDKFIKWSDYLILMYSITNHDSFLESQKYLDSIQDLVYKHGLGELNNGLPIKILLLGSKLDLERYREVHKHDVQSVLEKFSNKNFLNNENSLIIQSSEITSCEEYEIVQNLIHKLVKEIKNDREATEFANNQTIYNSDDNNVTDIKKLKSSTLNYSKSRSKSPMPNFNKIVNHESLTNVLQQSPNSNNNQFNISGSNTNNESSSNNSSLKNIEIGSTGTNNQIFPSIIANNTNSAKKPSSKFPFFTKILNKS